MSNINVVAVSGNLTRDPELRETGGGTAVCSMRVACNGRRKDGDEWVDDPNFFDVTVWGKMGENCDRFLSKGSAVIVQGRLNWREWTNDAGDKRQAVEIVASGVQFPPKGADRAPHPADQATAEAQPQAQPVGVGASTPASDVPGDTTGLPPAEGYGGFGGDKGKDDDDDIPF